MRDRLAKPRHTDKAACYCSNYSGQRPLFNPDFNIPILRCQKVTPITLTSPFPASSGTVKQRRLNVPACSLAGTKRHSLFVGKRRDQLAIYLARDGGPILNSL